MIASTVLSPMRPAIYTSYLESAVAGYAEENVASGRWPKEGALERSRADFQLLLPQGLATPGHYLYEIVAGEGGPTVGFLWFAAEDRHGMRSAFVYDIQIKEEYRRRGHASRAFLALESIVAGLGLPSIGLHVFGHNHAAQALYGQLGYTVTDINMIKPLNTRGHPNSLIGMCLRQDQ